MNLLILFELGLLKNVLFLSALYSFPATYVFSASIRFYSQQAYESTCDALRHLVPFVQFKKREKACNFNKSNTPAWLFLTFFKLYKRNAV